MGTKIQHDTETYKLLRIPMAEKVWISWHNVHLKSLRGRWLFDDCWIIHCCMIDLSKGSNNSRTKRHFK